MEKKKYIDSALRKVYAELKDTINEKTVLYSQHWKNCKEQTSSALSEAFDVDCKQHEAEIRDHIQRSENK